MVFVEEIFLGIILALLMDGLQFLPPPSWKTHGAKGCSRLDSRLENGRNWAFAEGGAGWGPLGCSGRVWSMSLPYCLLMDGFFRNPGRDVYKNPGKSHEISTTNLNLNWWVCPYRISGCHPSARLDLEVSDEWFHQNQTYELQKMEIVDFERVSNIKDVCIWTVSPNMINFFKITFWYPKKLLKIEVSKAHSQCSLQVCQIEWLEDSNHSQLFDRSTPKKATEKTHATMPEILPTTSSQDTSANGLQRWCVLGK